MVYLECYQLFREMGGGTDPQPPQWTPFGHRTSLTYNSSDVLISFILFNFWHKELRKIKQKFK